MNKPISELLPFVAIENFLPEIQFNTLRSSLSKLEVTDGLVERPDGPKLDTNVRKAKICFFSAKDEIAFFYHKIISAVGFLNQTYYKFDLHEIRNTYQYTVYEGSDNGYYNWHTDMDIDITKPIRKLSVVIQLTDTIEYYGGDLELSCSGDPQNTIKLPKNKNTLIVFPSYTPHRVSPVTNGVRKSIVCWVTGPRFR